MNLQPHQIDIDLSYRPHCYWPESPDREVLLSRIKGQARRDIVRQKLEEEGFTRLPTLPMRK